MEIHSTNEAWINLFNKYDIVNKINNDGVFIITAAQIKEFKEPRLMAKWDSSEYLPPIFKTHHINILPLSRSEYILSDFKLYEPIPELGEHVTKMQKVIVPDFESNNIKNITSEANSINVLINSKILDDFLSEDDNIPTFHGRMGTGVFSFNVDRLNHEPAAVNVRNAQCEIDGGFENSTSIVILEAKNVVYPDFHIRQLYYPFRMWSEKVSKPIRLVFSIYSNQIFRLFEYKFTEKTNYSSIKLVKTKNYSLQDTEINIGDLKDVFDSTEVKFDDNQKYTKIPFIQANSFQRIISLMEILGKGNKTPVEIAEIMQFDLRQSDYYYNAGNYLGIFSKKRTNEVNISLTKLGKSILKLNYKSRQLKLVSLILEHKIFNIMFNTVYNNGEIPSLKEIQRIMTELNVCDSGQIKRRASSVFAWLKWIFNLPKI